VFIAVLAKEGYVKVAAATLMLVVAAGTARAASLPFISDDYARARAEATARRLPLFVEVWAPW
jgi:hypothetical protein